MSVNTDKSSMNALLEHITKVKEDELGVKEFQVAVLSALLDIMKEQESLNMTLKNLSGSRSGDHHLGNMEEEVVTEDDSSADELTTRKGKRLKDYLINCWATTKIF